jgi:hypothetical protein
MQKCSDGNICRSWCRRELHMNRCHAGKVKQTAQRVTRYTAVQGLRSSTPNVKEAVSSEMLLQAHKTYRGQRSGRWLTGWWVDVAWPSRCSPAWKYSVTKPKVDTPIAFRTWSQRFIFSYFRWSKAFALRSDDTSSRVLKLTKNGYSWEAISRSASKQFPDFYGTQILTTVCQSGVPCLVINGTDKIRLCKVGDVASASRNSSF